MVSDDGDDDHYDHDGGDNGHLQEDQPQVHNVRVSGGEDSPSRRVPLCGNPPPR